MLFIYWELRRFNVHLEILSTPCVPLSSLHALGSRSIAGVSGRSPQHFPGAQVELRTVPGAGNLVPVAVAVVERSSPVGAGVGSGTRLTALRSAYEHEDAVQLYRAHRSLVHLAPAVGLQGWM